MTDSEERAQANSPGPTVAFDYIKGANFRAVHADGVIGGLTPNKLIHMALFAERHAIPRRSIVELNEDGSLGRVTDVETRASIVRELEFDVFIDVKTAKSIREWLDGMISEAEGTVS